MHQYLTADTSEVTGQTQATGQGLFAGLKFQLVDGDEELAELISANGGQLVDGGAGVDFTVADAASTTPAAGAQLVTRLYVDDCVDQEQLVDVDYFHRPVQVKKVRPS